VRSRYHFEPATKLSEPRKPGAMGFPQLGQFGIEDGLVRQINVRGEIKHSPGSGVS